MRPFKRKLVNGREWLTKHVNEHLVSLDASIASLKQDMQQITEQQRTVGKYDTVGIMQLSDHEIAVKLFNDLIMYLDPRDLAVVPHIALERIWEREITYAWLAVLEKDVQHNNPVVVDIGANFGYYGVLASQLNKKHGDVIFFEANPGLEYYIHKTLSVNWLNENSTVEVMAVGDKKGTAKLNILKDYVGSSSLQSIKKLSSYEGNQMELKAESVVTVPTIDLDSYCKEHKIEAVDLIKMDIEGYEETAYAGMRKIVSDSPNLIMFVEFTKDGYDKPETFYNQLLADFGTVYSIMPDGQLRHLPDTGYTSVIDAEESLTFLVFSKRQLSHVHQEGK